MKLTGKIKDISIDFLSNKAVLSLTINEQNDVKTLYDELSQEEKLSIEVKKYRKKRSLDANAYFWVLADKLAEKLCLTKEEVYRNAIKEIGGNSEIVCVQDKAVDRLVEGWRRNGLGWITDTFPSKLEGCTNVVLYYGSSTYDTKQMSLLISNIVEECKAQNIETMTPYELERLMSAWGG